MAMGSPIMPVPGMPTPMAFFRILALSHTVILVGTRPNSSVARATHSATAMGSVQPTAGTTSRFISARMRTLVSLSIIGFSLGIYSP